MELYLGLKDSGLWRARITASKSITPSNAQTTESSVHILPNLFAGFGIERGALTRQERGAIQNDFVLMSARNDLLLTSDLLLSCGRIGQRICGSVAAPIVEGNPSVMLSPRQTIDAASFSF